MRVGNSASLFQGRERGSLVCSLCAPHRDSGDDARASDVCRIGGTICVGRSGGVSAAYESGAAGPESRQRRTDEARPVGSSGWRTTRPLWIRLALLMLLTPLGILAAGTAWGEWGAKDFSDPQMRQQIAAASGNIAPPSQQPQGLARLSSLWSAPFPQYAPPFVHHPAFGYVMSAVFGSGLILGFFLLDGMDDRSTRRELRPGLLHDPTPKNSRGVVERSLASFVDALEHAFYAEELAKKNGLLQRIDPRVKIVAILPLIVIAALARRLWVIVALFVVAVVVATAVERSPGARWRKESGWACSLSPGSSRFQPCS